MVGVTRVHRHLRINAESSPALRPGKLIFAVTGHAVLQILSSADNLAGRVSLKLSSRYLCLLKLHISFYELSIIIIPLKINPVTEEMR